MLFCLAWLYHLSMKTREGSDTRIISLRLIKKKEEHIEFLEEIGVAATVKVNDSNPETEEKTSCTKEEK